MRAMKNRLALLALSASLALCSLASAAEAPRALSWRTVSVYHSYVDGTSKWPASAQFPTFESFVDHLAACGINEIALSAIMFMPMEYVDLAAIGYPEAVEFPKDEVDRRAAILDKNAAYAEAKGVRLLPAGYEFNVPAKFYFAHQEDLNPAGRFTDALSKHYGLEKWRIEKEKVVGNLSWNRPLYKKFWTDAHRELIRRLPHVRGFRQTYGEWAWSYENVTHADNVRDYLATLWGLLQQAHGDHAVLELRDWYVVSKELADPACPKVLVVAKDSGHDAGPLELGPWIKDYLKAGVPCLGEVNLTDAENTRPILWFDPDFIRTRIQNLAKVGADGFNLRSGQPGHWVTDLEYRAAGAIAAGKSFTAADTLAALQPRFGPAAAPMATALQRSGFVLCEYTKLHSGRYPWWQSDGISINVLHTGFRGFAGFEDPLDYIRADAVSLPDYVEALQLPPDQRAAREAQWKNSGLAAPPVILERIRQAGLDAKAAALAALKTAPPQALADPQQPVQELAASALMAFHTSRLFCSYVEMAIDHRQLKKLHQTDPALQQHLLAKLDDTAVEWTAIGRIGGMWFAKRINPEAAAAVWKKYAATIQKDLKLKYPGLDEHKVLVEPEALLKSKQR